MLFTLVTLQQITTRSMEKENQKAASLTPLVSGNLGSLVLIIKVMTSLQYSKRRVPATSLPKLTKAARNFPTGLGLRVPVSRLLISNTCLVSAVAVG